VTAVSGLPLMAQMLPTWSGTAKSLENDQSLLVLNKQ
jgi:hypothetical protein